MKAADCGYGMSASSAKFCGVLLWLAMTLVSSAMSAQSMSYGPLFTEGTNAQGFPIFMLIWHCKRCVGLHGQALGSPKEVARYMPTIQAPVIKRYGYRCWTLCRDQQDHIVGKPSPDYRNPFAKF